MYNWYEGLYNMELSDIQKESSLIKLANMLSELDFQSDFNESDTKSLQEYIKQRIIEVIQNNEIFLL